MARRFRSGTHAPAKKHRVGFACVPLVGLICLCLCVFVCRGPRMQRWIHTPYRTLPSPGRLVRQTPSTAARGATRYDAQQCRLALLHTRHSQLQLPATGQSSSGNRRPAIPTLVYPHLQGSKRHLLHQTKASEQCIVQRRRVRQAIDRAWQYGSSLEGCSRSQHDRPRMQRASKLWHATMVGHSARVGGHICSLNLDTLHILILI